MFRVFLLAVLLSVPLLGASPAPSSSQPTTLGESIDVRVVNVEAVVTDRAGVRVTGLEPSDFRLIVDGVETPIDYFSEVLGGDVVDRTHSLQAADGLIPGEALGTSYLVFVDDFFTLRSDRNRVLQAFVEELGFLTPRDRMAVVAWDGHHVDMLSTWSRSMRDLTLTFREAMARPSQGLNRLAELRAFEHDRRSLAPVRAVGRGSFRSTSLGVEERAYLGRLSSQLEGVVAAASSTLRGFAEPSGRKVMLLLSGAWPERPVDWVVASPFRRVMDRAPAGSFLYGRLTDTANLLGYTLYPIDVAGMDQGSVADASVGFASISRHDRDVYREREVHHGLERLAFETGGLALLNGMRDRPLETVFADTRTFYWIGFSPEKAGDDSHHDVRLEVLPLRLKLRSRRSYVDLSRGTEVTMAVESALLFGNPATDPALEVALGPSRRAGFGKVEVPLRVELPMEALTLLPSGDRWVAELELRVAVMDDRGYHAEMVAIPILLSETEPPTSGDRFSYETILKMRARDHEMVVAVYDGASGEVFAGSAAFFVR